MTATDLHRKEEITKIKCGQRDLKLDDETYRAVLLRITGKTSSTTMTMQERHAVLAYFKQQGAYANLPKKRISRDPQARMIHALWGELAKTGKLDNPTSGGLRAFCARMVHPDQPGLAVDPDHLTIEQGRQIIEALKGWLKRVA